MLRRQSLDSKGVEVFVLVCVCCVQRWEWVWEERRTKHLEVGGSVDLTNHAPNCICAHSDCVFGLEQGSDPKQDENTEKLGRCLTTCVTDEASLRTALKPPSNSAPCPPS